MREILFRGKRRDNGQWVEGAFCPKNSEGPFSPMKDDPSIIKLDKPHDGFWFAVDGDTVCQYTGLKDKNGKQIFEGDIVMGRDFSEGDGFGVVEWNDGAFEVNNQSSTGTFHENYWGQDLEVIGNIHDNPELLEVESDE